MEDKDKAMVLVQQYVHGLRGFILSKYEATQCAKLDLQNSIDLLELIIEESTEVHQVLNTPKRLCRDILNPKLKSLRNQLEHLNSI
jgi:hypothetical protein